LVEDFLVRKNQPQMALAIRIKGRRARSQLCRCQGSQWGEFHCKRDDDLFVTGGQEMGGVTWDWMPNQEGKNVNSGEILYVVSILPNKDYKMKPSSRDPTEIKTPRGEKTGVGIACRMIS